ncbi:noelin-like [Amphiura filiformis]|uniref:noelin-like n=1 Tax=Amphiura filiformis TaxID=82378 RepID=UPI003B21CBDB
MEFSRVWVILLLSVANGRPTFGQLLYGSISDTDGKCVCTFDAPLVAVCTRYETDHMSIITSVEQGIANVTSHLDQFIDEWNLWDDRYNEFDRNVSRLMSSCQIMEKRHTNDINPDMESLSEMRKGLLRLEEELNIVTTGLPQSYILSWMNTKMESITMIINNLTTSVVGMDEAQRKRRIAELESDLQECRERPSDIQHRLTVRQWPRKGSKDTCKKLSLILRPFTVRGKFAGVPEGPKGPSMWFADPLEDPTAVWLGTFEARVKTANGVEIRSTVYRFNQTSLFETSADNFVTYYLPDKIEKSSIVAHDGHLYYMKFNTRTLVKFSIDGNTTVTSNNLPSTVGIGSKYDYAIDGQRSSIDLEVDEAGVWLIYSTPANQGLVVLSKINTTTLEIEDTWSGNFPKKFLGDCFVACGTLYCISPYALPNIKVNYFYNTKTNEEGFMNVPFDSKYGEIKSVKYNPYDQKLYVWDDGYAVVYDLVFG